MTDPAYFRLLKDYRRILNQRNVTLRSGRSRREREVWNGELAEKGCALIWKRVELTSTLQRYLNEHASLLEAPFEYVLRYDSSIMRGGATTGNGGGAERPTVQAAFENKLLSLESEELHRGTTLVGPHRDDLSMKMGDKDLRKFGSQGQRRLLAVLLKLSELSHLEEELKEPCVLLLDDVFSEFDEKITQKLQQLLTGSRQVFVTSPVRLEWTGSQEVSVFGVRSGRIVPVAS
jgi:DNA replication and repair protein RecF